MTIKLIREGTQWVAQLLDHDLAGQGPTEHEALESLAYVMRGSDAVAAEKGVGGWRSLPPAPDEYRSL